MEVVACPSIFTIPFLIQNLNSKKVCDGLTAEIMQKHKRQHSLSKHNSQIEKIVLRLV